MSPLPIRAGRAIAPPTVESLPTRRALQGSENRVLSFDHLIEFYTIRKRTTISKMLFSHFTVVFL